MNYNKITLLFFFLIVGCVTYPIDIKKSKIEIKSTNFSNKGFTLIYNDKHFNNKLINSKIENRSLKIFQKNLKKNTKVKITNLLNSKTIIAEVGKKTKYPLFFNSVISERIAKELEINENEPYIEIIEIINNSAFVAKTAKIFDEEKNVSTKVPIDDIKIKDLSSTNKLEPKKIVSKFNYTIKIGDFYFEKSAKQMKKRILSETTIKNVNIIKISNTNFRVFLGPYNNLNSLKKSFNAISILEFDNIEIIKK